MSEEIKKEIDVIKDDIKDYEKFAFRDNIFNLVIIFIITESFEKLIKSISENLAMPILNFITNQTDGNWRNFISTPIDGMKLEIGHFMGVFLNFILTSLILYLVWKKFGKKQDN